MLTRRRSAQLEALRLSPPSADNNPRSSSASSTAHSTAAPPSSGPSLLPPLTLSSDIPLSSSAMSAVPSEDMLSASAFPRRPSDEWREFFNLGGAEGGATSSEAGLQAMELSMGDIDGLPSDQEARWSTMFAGDFVFGEGSSPPFSAHGSATQQQRGSFESESSLASSYLDNYPTSMAYSVASTAPTSLAPSPTASACAEPAAIVLQACTPTSTRPSSLPSVPSVLRSGYSSIMPREVEPKSASPKARPAKSRKGKSGVDALIMAPPTAPTYPGGANAWLSLSAADRPFVHEPASTPQSAPASTTVFSRRLAVNARVVKNIKDEDDKDLKLAPPTPKPAPTPKAVEKKLSVEEIAPAVPVASTSAAPRPRKPRARPEGHTPRPPNAWILYRSAQIQILKSDENISKKPQSDISKLIGYMWRDESPAVRKHYEEQAAIKKAEHKTLYPDYTFCPVRKPKGDAASASSRASTPASEKLSIGPNRPGLPRRATAPSARTSPYSPRKRRVTSEVELDAQHITVTIPQSSLLGLDLDVPRPPRQQEQEMTPFVPHSAKSYQSDFALECGMEALLASFDSPMTPLGGDFPLAGSPSSAPFPGYLNLDAAASIDVGAQSTAPSTYAAWSAFEATTPTYFPEQVPGEYLPQPPMSAPAAYAAFNFGPVPSIFDAPQPHAQPQQSPTSRRYSALPQYEAFPSTHDLVTSSYASSAAPSLSEMTSPATTESSLASPSGAAYPYYEQLHPAPFEMQWEGSCTDSTGNYEEVEYKRRLSTQWMAGQEQQEQQHAEHFSHADYAFPSHT